MNLSLDSHGFCYIPFKKFLVIVEVPDNSEGLFIVYTKVFDLQTSAGQTRIEREKTAMRLNSLQDRMRGSSLGMDGDEVNQFFSAPISGLSFDRMMEYMEDFLQTAIEINTTLQAIR